MESNVKKPPGLRCKWHWKCHPKSPARTPAARAALCPGWVHMMSPACRLGRCNPIYSPKPYISQPPSGKDLPSHARAPGDTCAWLYVHIMCALKPLHETTCSLHLLGCTIALRLLREVLEETAVIESLRLRNTYLTRDCTGAIAWPPRSKGTGSRGCRR